MFYFFEFIFIVQLFILFLFFVFVGYKSFKNKEVAIAELLIGFILIILSCILYSDNTSEISYDQYKYVAEIKKECYSLAPMIDDMMHDGAIQDYEFRALLRDKEKIEQDALQIERDKQKKEIIDQIKSNVTK